MSKTKNQTGEETKTCRRSRKDQAGRDHICGCGKSYLSYPALYTHIKTKHDGIRPVGTFKNGSNNANGSNNSNSEYRNVDKYDGNENNYQQDGESRKQTTNIQSKLPENILKIIEQFVKSKDLRILNKLDGRAPGFTFPDLRITKQDAGYQLATKYDQLIKVAQEQDQSNLKKFIQLNSSTDLQTVLVIYLLGVGKLVSQGMNQYYQNFAKAFLFCFSTYSQQIWQSIFNKKGGIVIIASLTLIAVCSIGLISLDIQTDPQGLWVSKDSIGYQQQMNFNQQYGAFFRTQNIMLTQNNGKQLNVFTKQHITAFYFLLSLLNQKKIVSQGRQIHIDNLCYKPIVGKGCYRPNPVDVWKMNITDLYIDQDIQYTAMCINSRSKKSRIPCSDQNQLPIIKQSIYGGISCNQTKDQTSDIIIPCQHCWIESKAMLATYLLNNDQFTKQSALQWEKNVLIDSIHKYNSDNGSFVQQYKKYFNVTQDGTVTFDNDFKLNINDFMSKKLNVHFQYLSQRSIPDQLINQTQQNMWIVVISYSAMFIYMGIAIGQFPSLVSSGFTLALIGIAIVLGSVFSSMGIISYLGINATMISQEVIPFLVLAIGVDNMFIIKNALQRQQGNLQTRLVKALKQVGPSILTATICQALAFLVGSFTKMPALQSFCIQAAIAIIFNFLFQIFTFVVVLTYDEQRRQKRKADVLCCIKTNQRPQEPKQFWKKMFRQKYNNVIQNKGCQWFTIILSSIMLVVSIIGACYVPVGLNQQVSMQLQSDLYNYFTVQKKFIQIGPPAYIVFNGFDYQNTTHQNYISQLNNEVSKLKYIIPPVYSWFASFNNFRQKDAMWADVCGSTNIDSLTYQQQLRKFLAVSITSSCCQSYGICGEQYNKDLIFNDQGKLVSSRLRVMHSPLRTSYDYIRAARQMRLCVQYVLGPLLQKQPNLTAYPYSLFYVYYDQYGYIRSVAIQNLLLALATVFLIVTLIKNIKIALVICGMVLITTLNLIGFVFVTNSLFPDHGFVIQVNAISVVNVITCVGLAVQFTAHICIQMFNLRGTQQNKLKTTLGNTGSSVFIGIGLTKFVGVLVLALAKSTLFRLYYFRMYLGIVVLGIFNGLVLLPILLYKWGPKTNYKQQSISNAKTLLTNSDITQS